MRNTRAARRKLLLKLYDAYFENPLDMLSPQDLMADGTLAREDLPASAYYLNDRQFIEVMIGYNPPMFAAARITAKGIDLVENHFEFNLLFPPGPDEVSDETAELPALVERLVEEADFAPLDGEARKCLLRDVQFLRDELARPESRWRLNVIGSFLDWIGGHFEAPHEALPSLEKVRGRLQGLMD